MMTKEKKKNILTDWRYNFKIAIRLLYAHNNKYAIKNKLKGIFMKLILIKYSEIIIHEKLINIPNHF